MKLPPGCVPRGKKTAAAALAAGLIIIFFLCLRLAALLTLPQLGDEPDDLNILRIDLESCRNFFHTADTYELEQSRLPFVLSAPLVSAFKQNALIPLRLLFYCCHLCYLFISFRLVLLITGRRSAALVYVLLLATSCYLASFSIFAITTGDSLYLLFHIAAVYSFLKSRKDWHETQVFAGALRLALLLGACIASKLFGVLLLAALMLFHLLQQRGAPLNLRGVRPGNLLAAATIFLSGIALINLLPLPPAVRLWAAVGLGCGYLGVLAAWAVQEKHSPRPPMRVSFVLFWGALIVTAFGCTLVLSPVYLNLSNLLRTVSWFGNWNAGTLVARSHLSDMLVIIALKYGPVSWAALAVAIALSALRPLRSSSRSNRGPAGFSGSSALLFILIFAIHFAAISLTRHKVTWYPLAIFPFLYLPVVRLFRTADRRGLRRFKAAALLCVAVIAADNAVRYLTWFPYGHFDGAQYGREQIGWNRAGFITFEVQPELLAYLRSRCLPYRAVVHCEVVDVPLYNNWFRILLARRYAGEGGLRYRFTSTGWAEDTLFDYLLTSPVYYPEFEAALEDRGVRRIKTFVIKGIPVLSVWIRGDAAAE
jgi:hypothetical protein